MLTGTRVGGLKCMCGCIYDVPSSMTDVDWYACGKG